MFEYGVLKCIRTDDNFKWVLETIKHNLKLEGKWLLKVLNKLGKDNWELVSIGTRLGFIMKRRIK